MDRSPPFDEAYGLFLEPRWSPVIPPPLRTACPGTSIEYSGVPRIYENYYRYPLSGGQAQTPYRGGLGPA